MSARTSWADIVEACADMEPLTIRAYTWLPPIPYRENRLLPMPLRYADTPRAEITPV